MTETPEEAAGFAALQNETDIELVDAGTEANVATANDAAREGMAAIKSDLAAKPEPEAKAADPEPKKPVRLVPHEALHEERVKRQALERRIADMERAQQPAPRQQQANADDGDIDENENPLGAIAQLKARIRQRDEVEEQQTRIASENRDIIQRMAPRVEAYAKDHPEYGEQFQYVRQSRATELQLLGYPDHAIGQQIQAEEMALARQALNNDLDPGEVIAKLATARGWRAKEAAPEPKPDPKPDPEASKKIERLQAGQRAAKSSSTGGGSGPEADMTLERLASLDGAAFDAAFAKHGSRLLGG